MVPVDILECATGTPFRYRVRRWSRIETMMCRGPRELIQGLLGGGLAALSGIRSVAGGGRSSNSDFRRGPDVEMWVGLSVISVVSAPMRVCRGEAKGKDENDEQECAHNIPSPLDQAS